MDPRDRLRLDVFGMRHHAITPQNQRCPPSNQFLLPAFNACFDPYRSVLLRTPPMPPGRLSPVQLRRLITDHQQLMQDEDDVVVMEAVDGSVSSSRNPLQRRSSSAPSRSGPSLRPLAPSKIKRCESPKEIASSSQTPVDAALLHVLPSKTELEIMPDTEEFEAMVKNVAALTTSCTGRRLPVFVALTDG